MASKTSAGSPGSAEAQRRQHHHSRWQRSSRTLQVVLALGVFCAVWLVAFGYRSEPAPLVPDASVQFSLDLEVVATTEHGLVYAVEQRARPAYRIFSLDPSSGEIKTVYTVPTDAVIYGIALSNNGDTLAVTYSPDFELEGSGLWTLDLASGEFTTIIDVATGRYFVDPVWSSDSESVLATQVTRTEAGDDLAIVELTLDGGLVVRAEGAVDPAVEGEDLFFLRVDEDNARRSVGHIEANGTQHVIEIADHQFDLDHLITRFGETYVAVLESKATPVVTIGEPADAHGNHDVFSTWWRLGTAASEVSTPTSLEPIIVYDAAATSDGAIVYATLEGLSIGDDDGRIDLIRSRAIRFVAA